VTYSVTPTQQDIFTLLTPFVQAVTGLGNGLVIQGIPNRVASPVGSPLGYIVLTPIHLRRLRTNEDTWDTTNPAPTATKAQQGVRIDIQFDCYGQSAQEWAAALTTVLRDDTGCAALAGLDPANPVCQPLFCDEARMIPLDDTEGQYEQRWTFDAALQYNPTVTVPMQFADALSVGTINVDERYPP
jgi:hypothetical protein